MEHQQQDLGKKEPDFNRKRRSKRAAEEVEMKPLDKEARMAKLRKATPSKRPRRKRTTSEEEAPLEEEDPDGYAALREGAVRAVTALLAATNDERSKRGK